MGCRIAQDSLGKAGRQTFPIAMLAYPFYLWKRSPGKEGSHYDPKCDLFTPAEEPLVSCNIPLCSYNDADRSP